MFCEAYTDDIPPLQEGTHVVRIVYDVRTGWHCNETLMSSKSVDKVYNSASHRCLGCMKLGQHLAAFPGRNVRWDRFGTDFDSDATGDFMRLQHSGRAGAIFVVPLVTANCAKSRSNHFAGFECA